MIKAAVAGAAGHMGRLIIRAIDETEGIGLAGALEAPGNPNLGRDAGTVAGLSPLSISIEADLKR